MIDFFSNNISRIIKFLKENPSILYTTFLLIVIPLAFLASSQQFLNATNKNQERLEKERIGLMEDVFAAAVNISDRTQIGDGELQKIITQIGNQNESITSLKIVLFENGTNIVAASLDEHEIGKEDTTNGTLYSSAGLNLDQSIIFEEYDGSGVRHWKAVRALPGSPGSSVQVHGFVFTDVSMVSIDDLAAQNILHAYYILLGIIFVIVILLIRQARVVDYSVLYRKLKEVDQMKDDFVSMAAHELRTPLSVIKGYLSMISPERLTPTEKEGIVRVNISLDTLNTLVNDILDVVRIEQGRMGFDVKDADVSPIITEVVDSLQYLVKEKNLSLSYVKAELSPIRTDSVRLKQVLVNLIGNAIKYTPQGSITVIASEENGTVSIRVRDTGIGISAEDQKKLFAKFSRIRSHETQDIRGTGLGLWISSQIVSNMNGHISVESIKGKGSDFVISFPVASSPMKG